MPILFPRNTASTTTSQKSTIDLIADGADIAIHKLVYKSDAGKIKEADSAAKITARVIGITTEAITDGNPGTVQTYGEYENGAWAFDGTSNARLYLSETGTGTLSETAPTTSAEWQNSPAYILSATKAFIDPRPDVVTEVLA